MSLSGSQIDQFQAYQAALMADTCQIGTYASSTLDDHGQPVESWTYGTAISCGLDIASSSRQMQNAGAENTVSFIDGRLRLPLGTTLARRDRIKVTKMAGSTLDTALVFEVVGEPKPSHTVLLVDVKWAAL